MTSAVGQQQRTNAALKAATAGTKKGLCTAIDWPNGLVTVRFPGGSDTQPVQMQMVGAPPVVGWTVIVGFFGATPICLGPESRPPLGTVASVPASGLLTVTCDDGQTHTVTLSSGMSLAIGDKVQLDWGINGTVIAKPVADPSSGQELQPGGPVVPEGPQTRTFYPYTSATWRDGVYASGWVGGDMWDSDHNRGASFYQGIAATIPDSARGSLSVWVPTAAGTGSSPSIGGHALAGPSGDLSIVGRRVIGSGGGSVDISDLFDAFKTGSLLGIGTGGGGNWRFPGAGGQNWAITATYTS